MRKLTALLVVLSFLCFSELGQWSALAQGRLAALRASCSAEVANHCSDIGPEVGRLAACLYSHEKQLSDRCGEVLITLMDRLAVSLRTLGIVTRDCRSDAQRLCNGVIAGQGNLVGCLSRMKGSLSPQCKSAIEAASLSGMDDP